MAILPPHTHNITIIGVPSNDPNVPFTWNFGFDGSIGDGSAVNTGSNDMLDIGDRYGTVNASFGGRTVEFGGETYAIFSTRSFSYIPYNKEEHDLAPLANGGASTGFTETGARVFNCFATGTRIATPDGDKPIEMLRAGDLVLTHDGRSTPVIWRARQSIVNPCNLSVGRGPVRIEADAPLTVTADHALLFDDMLINAGTLVNGTTIRLLPLAGLPSMFTYWHVELEKHECVVANGVPAESFIDYVGRSGFDNYDEYLALAGADRLIPEMPFARISAHRLVPPDLREALGIAPPSYMPRSKAA